MALTRGIQPEYLIGMPSVPTETIKEGASQSFKNGEVVVISSGYAIASAAGSDEPTLGTILGVAAMDARNVTTYPDLQYTPALPGVVFSAQLQNAAGTAAVAQANVGVKYGFSITSNKWWVDTDEVTDTRVLVIGLKDPVGTANGVVFFTFLPNTTVWGQNGANS